MISYTRQPYYLEGTHGKLFCIYFSPSEISQHPVLIFSPFAEEMNKSRRMLSQQAAQLAEMGAPVLMFDYFGTGDSEGDFADASWEIWVSDLSIIINWLLESNTTTFNILAMRMGALLTTRISPSFHKFINKVVYWQPVTSGELLMSQFYRLKLASDMLGKDSGLTLKDIKNQLQDNQHVEIAGYSLNPALAQELSNTKLQQIESSVLKDAYWVELINSEEKPVPPASQRVIDSLCEDGANIHVKTVIGSQFWSVVELVDVPQMHAITNQLLTR